MEKWRKKSFHVFIFLTFLFVFQTPKLVKITCSNHARRERNDCHTKQGRQHADKTANVSDRCQIAISNSGKGNSGPIQGIKEIAESRGASFWINMGLGIEHDQCRKKHVKNGDTQHRQQDSFLFPDHPAQHMNLIGVAENLKQPQNFQKSGDTENLEAFRQDTKAWKYGQQVNDGPKGERIKQKGQSFFP